MHTKLDFFLDFHEPGIKLKIQKLQQNHGHVF